MGQNTRKDPRAKVLSMTVRYRSATLGEFIEHHSYDVSRGGMFIKTPSPFPAGTLLKFEVKIAEEQRVMQGVGRVVWKRDQPVEQTGEPAGMGIKFIKIDEASRAVIERLIESRDSSGPGAFENSPEAREAKMFPGGVFDLPPPEDRTVMKPASELLEEALRKTGQESATELEAPRSSRVVREGARREGSGNFEPVRATPQSLSPEAPAPPEANREKTASGDVPRIPSLEAVERESRDSTLRSQSTTKTMSPSGADSAPLVEEEGGGGRALLLFVAVAAVAIGIFVLTKRGGTIEPEQDPESAPLTVSAPSAIVTPVEPPPAPEPSVEEAPAEPEAPPVSSAEESTKTAPPPAPAVTAQPVKKSPVPRASSSPVVTPAPSSPAPVKEAAPPQAPSGAEAPTSPSVKPAESTPAPEVSPENPY